METNTDFFGVNLAEKLVNNELTEDMPKLGSLENILSNKSPKYNESFEQINEQIYRQKIQKIQNEFIEDQKKNIKKLKKLNDQRAKLSQEKENLYLQEAPFPVFENNYKLQNKKIEEAFNKKIEVLNKEISILENEIEKERPKKYSYEKKYLGITRWYQEINMDFLNDTIIKDSKKEGLSDRRAYLPKFLIFPLESSYSKINICIIKNYGEGGWVQFETTYDETDIKVKQYDREKFREHIGNFKQQIEIKGEAYFNEKFALEDATVINEIKTAQKLVKGTFYIITEAQWETVEFQYNPDPLVVFEAEETETWHYVTKFNTTPAEEAIYKTEVKGNLN